MVPSGWERKYLKDGIKLISGQHVEAKYVNDQRSGKPYLTGPADFPNGVFFISKYTSNAKSYCEKDDILITVKGSGTGKIIFADNNYAISRQLIGN